MSKVKDALNILTELGLPKAQQNKRSALTLLALADIKERDPLSLPAISSGDHRFFSLFAT